MSAAPELSDDETYWLRRVRDMPHDGVHDHFTMPDEIHDALVEKGLIRWQHGIVELTDDGVAALRDSSGPERG